MKKRVKLVLESVLKEYDLKQKTKLTNIINKLVAASPSQSDQKSYETELNDLIKTYKYTDDSFYSLENEAVYNEFYDKLIDFSQDKGISLS